METGYYFFIIFLGIFLNNERHEKVRNFIVVLLGGWDEGCGPECSSVSKAWAIGMFSFPYYSIFIGASSCIGGFNYAKTNQQRVYI
jgi:hypothetical protein